MLHPSPADWDQWQIREETHRFFVLYWTEIFDEETPDTWQVRTCNIKTLLRELVSAAKIAESFDAYRGVIRSLLDETLMVIKRDEILAHHFPFVKQYLEPWRRKEIGEADLADLEHLAQVILGNLDGYWDRCVEVIDRCLKAADPKKKTDRHGVGGGVIRRR